MVLIRTITLLVPTLLIAGGPVPAGQATKQEAIQQELKLLEGRWRLISLETDGEQISVSRIQRAEPEIFIQGTTLKDYVRGKQTRETDFSIDPTRSPKTLDAKIVEGEPVGATSKAIYDLAGDRLRICWIVYGVRRERPSSFATFVDSGLLLEEYERIK